jgi:SP family general alpha glucoside:H+ symporter-like MFS transporter
MATTGKDGDAPIEVRKLSIAAEEVRDAIEVEHALTFWEAVKLYPKAIGWSMYFSLGVIMLGTAPINDLPRSAPGMHTDTR